MDNGMVIDHGIEGQAGWMRAMGEIIETMVKPKNQKNKEQSIIFTILLVWVS